MGQEGITFAGNLILDIGYTIDAYPKKGNLVKIYDAKHHTGGSNNIIIDMAKLDCTLPIKVSGLVGADENGKLVLDTLKAYKNIKLDNVTIEGKTAVTFAMTERVGKQRTFFYDPGTSEEYGEEHIDWEKLDAKIFHLEYLLTLGELDKKDAVYGTKAAKVLCQARKRGMKTSIDVVSEESIRYQEIVLPALAYTDYCIVNEVEAEGITNISLSKEGDIIEDGIIEENVGRALERIKDLGVAKWVVIHSPQCGYGLDCETGERVKVKSLTLPKDYIKGTTGAGDAYCAGVLYGAYHNFSMEESLQAGVACAVCSLSAEDSNSGVFSYRETMKVYETYQNK